MLPCHAQERLGNTTGMLKATGLRHVLPVVVRIMLQGAVFLAVLPPMVVGSHIASL